MDTVMQFKWLSNTFTSRRYIHRFRTIAGSAFLSLLIGSTALADDTETLVGQVIDTDGPNVTLIIDTSGSMASRVLINEEKYDPTVTYPGPYAPFDDPADARYFYTITTGNFVVFLDETNTDIDAWIRQPSMLCDAALQAMNTTGYFTSRYAQYTGRTTTGIWDFPAPAGTPTEPGSILGENRFTECQSDLGVHGETTDAPEVYPINLTDPLPGERPWTADENDPRRIDWDSTSTRYTFFSNNFLNWIHYQKTVEADPVLVTRLDIVKDVSTNLINSLAASSLANNDGLNVGLMRFSTAGTGGMVLKETSDIVAGADDLITQIAAMNADGNTPLAETMLEATLYYGGRTVLFGNNTEPVPSVAASINQGNYISPITAACQKNYIVLLTDGQPVGDTEANTQIEGLTGTCDESCLDEISIYMDTHDFSPTLAGVQNVSTFVIGFFTDFELLENTATGQITIDENGDPLETPQSGYFLASDPGGLSSAFASIFQTAVADVSSFTSPAVSVNSLNRLTNRDTLYFTMFSPSARGEPHWDGNLKAYRIGRTAGSDTTSILDATGSSAVNADGTFKANAISIWSLLPDGGDVGAGGMASRLDGDRNIYSNVGTGGVLSSAENRVHPDNANLTATVMGTTTDQLVDVIDFARGLADDGTPRKILGDPLHSQPLIITFSGAADDLMLFYGTNDGYLHAVDPTPDNTVQDLEEFAFIPEQLLSQIPRLRDNPPSNDAVANKAYGMDGPITAWIDEQGSSANSVVDAGEDLFVYAGMRRGGDSYYALDMSNRSAPELAFEISPSSTGFERLGDSWSSATHGKIKINNAVKDVLFFGGGYDENQDSSNSADSKGNAVYIADARTGALIWSAGNTGSADLELAQMTHSIPSDVRIIDINQDGLVDRMYVGDMGAKVWRFDIDNFAETGDTAITGGLLADLGDAGGTSERRFYAAPSVARFAEDGNSFLTVSIGSGYRSHPLDTSINDRLYVIRDNNVFGPALDDNDDPEYGDSNADLLITESDLITIDGSTPIQSGQFGKGWMLPLTAAGGEKSLSSALTADGRIFFTTYSPGATPDTCTPTAAVGTGRLYGIDVLTGLPALYDDPVSGDPIFNVELGTSGIPATPRLIFTEPQCTDCTPGEEGQALSDVSLVVGTQVFDPQISTAPVRTYWYQTDADGGE